MSKVGFVGLGIMGKPMAKNLLKSGFELMVNDLNQDAVEELVSEGATAATPQEIGENCSFIFISLPNGDIVQDVLFKKDGIASAIKEDTIICDTSSVTPEQSKFCYEKLKEKDVGFIDAPVSGGEPKAIDGTLAFMAGGDEEVFEALTPYFNAMGDSAILVGPSGSGSVTKLTNQVIVNLTIAAISEAFVLAKKSGADPWLVYKAIKDGLAGSTVLDAKIPMIVEGNFKPGGKISINHKDIKNVLATAHEVDVPVPLTSQLFEIMQALKVSGHMDDDHGGIIQFYEQLADTEVRSDKNKE